MKKLPIGIQTFEKLINEDYCYVDKTPFIKKLVDSGQYYFLSRPRRFGKSLFLSTIKSAFKGQKELFKGLSLYNNWQWEEKRPVIHISFGSGVHRSVDELKITFDYILNEHSKQYGFQYTYSDQKNQFAELIKTLYKKFNKRVVILIDEYDKPILDNINKSEIATSIRDELKNYYSVIKDSDAYIRFVFITGVSKFSKMNLFSGLNNLEDITIDKNYAEICGYTHKDLKTVFKQNLKGANWDLVKRWYNGYYYFGEKVYNPFDILLFISKGLEFRNYWWNTGNPGFLITKLKESNYYIPKIENAIISEEGLDTFDVEYIDLLALLWQTGYLTFEKKFTDEFGAVSYKLTIPNLEIQFSLNQFFIDYLTNQRYEKLTYKSSMTKALKDDDFDQFIEVLKSIFSSIPYSNYANNIISNYEGYYSSVVFVYLSALGYQVIAEDITNKGRIDLTLKMEEKVVIIEFKVDAKEHPIKQIKEKKYYEKYVNTVKSIYLIGIKFYSKEKNIGDYEWEKMESRA